MGNEKSVKAIQRIIAERDSGSAIPYILERLRRDMSKEKDDWEAEKDIWYCAKCLKPPNSMKYGLVTITENFQFFQKGWWTGSDWDGSKVEPKKVRFWKKGANDV